MSTTLRADIEATVKEWRKEMGAFPAIHAYQDCADTVERLLIKNREEYKDDEKLADFRAELAVENIKLAESIRERDSRLISQHTGEGHACAESRDCIICLRRIAPAFGVCFSCHLAATHSCNTQDGETCATCGTTAPGSTFPVEYATLAKVVDIPYGT